MDRKEKLEKVAKRLRLHALRMTTAAGSGHPTTCLSAADLIACLFFGEMRFNPRDPDDPGNDEFILSKGHAAPLLWAVYAEAGLISLKSLLDLRKITSDLEGHPTPRMKWIKAATGSLGQGLSVGVGIALAQKMEKSGARTFVLLGDGECAEGAVWEAADAASRWSLRNLTAIVDINRLGQSEPTMHQHDIRSYSRKFKAFGWDAIAVDGHRIDRILEALKACEKNRKPMAILAKTLKGKGISFLEDRNGWHGKPLNSSDLARALEEFGCLPEIDARKLLRRPRMHKKTRKSGAFRFPKTSYKQKTATRRAYGNALPRLGKINDRVVVIDGDVKNSTYADTFFEAYPERAFQSYIAEQNMVGMGIGLAAKKFIPFIATFAAFLTRAHDQIRMGSYSFSNLKLCGSHVGVSIGEDGPSQMGLEDLSLFRAIPDCVVLYPSDASSTEACVESMARHPGMAYLRTTRPATDLVYRPEESFPIGGSKVLRKGKADAVTIIAAGITVHEALKAHAVLKGEGLSARIIDAYSVQPLDVRTIRREVGKTDLKAIVVEDHYEGGGLGEAVSQALAGRAKLIHLCIRELPRSGKPEELLEKYGISAKHIVRAAKRLARL